MRKALLVVAVAMVSTTAHADGAPRRLAAVAVDVAPHLDGKLVGALASMALARVAAG